MPTFDVNAARQAGASDDQILSYLAQRSPNFDVQGALGQASKADVINYLSTHAAPPASNQPELWASHGPAPKPGDIGYRDPRPLSQRLLNPQGGMPGSFEGHPENLAGYVQQSAGEVAGGASDIAQGNIARGTHRVISGVGTGVTPFTPFMAAAAPAAFARAVAGGALGGAVASHGAEAFGASPEQTALAGDVGNIVGGGVGVKTDQVPANLGAKARAVGSTLADELISRIPVAGRAVRRPSFADYINALRAKAPMAPVPAPEAPLLTPEDLDQYNPAAGIVPGTNVPTRDVIAENPGEAAGLAARGQRGQAPLTILPSQNRGLALPGDVAPQLQNLPWLRQIEPAPYSTTDVPPDYITNPDENVLAGGQGVRIQAPKLLPQKATSPDLPSQTELGRIIEQQLREGMGAPPPPAAGKPIYQRPAETVPSNGGTAAEAPEVPYGFTPITSRTGLTAYRYDPQAQEMTIMQGEGKGWVYGDVSPEDAAAWERAESKGKAWPVLKQNPMVAKILNGKRVAAKPGLPRASSDYEFLDNPQAWNERNKF